MPNSFTCPYCQKEVAISDASYSEHWISRDTINIKSSPPRPGQMVISHYTCPSCHKIMITATVDHGDVLNTVNIEPLSLAKQFPSYVPETIRQDYEEACSIVNLSPKASATLSRRCLQGMIRDFFQLSRNTLYEEIDAIKPQIPTEQWAVLDGLRRIGNIGAHMEKDINLIIDIEPNEAEKLIKLIELLINQWYIERHNQQQLYADIIDIDADKQNQRKNKE